MGNEHCDSGMEHCAYCDLEAVTTITVKARGYDGKEFNVLEDYCETHREMRIASQLTGKDFGTMLADSRSLPASAEAEGRSYVPEVGVWREAERDAFVMGCTRGTGHDSVSCDEASLIVSTVAALLAALKECHAKLGPADFAVMDEESGTKEYDSISALIAEVEK